MHNGFSVFEMGSLSEGVAVSCGIIAYEVITIIAEIKGDQDGCVFE
jgi:hypothetical protein